MAEAKPLQEIMRRVSEGLDLRAPAPAKAVLNEFDAFLILDGLLTDLNKHYLDAKEQRQSAVREFGEGGMSDMAAILEDLPGAPCRRGIWSCAPTGRCKNAPLR